MAYCIIEFLDSFGSQSMFNSLISKQVANSKLPILLQSTLAFSFSKYWISAKLHFKPLILSLINIFTMSLSPFNVVADEFLSIPTIVESVIGVIC